MERREEEVVPTTSLKTTFNGLNILLGVSILSTPYALLSGGWLSISLLFLLAVATFYTGCLLEKCMVSDANIRTYPDIAHTAFGRKGKLVISWILNLELYMIATSFLIFVGDNLHNLFPHFKLEMHGHVAIEGRNAFILLVTLLLMPTVWIDNLSTLSYLSATGIVATILVVGSILWSGIFDGIGFDHRGHLFHWRGLPTSLGLYALSFGGHPIFPTLYTSMENKRHFSLVLLICILASAITSAAIAIMGYLMFGSKLESMITLNLPRDKLSSKVATYTAMVNPLTKYALILKPLVTTIETRFPTLAHRTLYKVLMRSILVCSSAIIALTIPFYGSLMSLIGSFTAVAASILIPCMCYLKISGMYKNLCLESVIIGLTMLMGLVVLVTGTYKSVADIIHDIFHHHHS